MDRLEKDEIKLNKFYIVATFAITAGILVANLFFSGAATV